MVRNAIEEEIVFLQRMLRDAQRQLKYTDPDDGAYLKLKKMVYDLEKQIKNKAEQK